MRIDQVTYFMPREMFLEKFPRLRVPKKHWIHCDYCVNHYGLDLCGCGSGRKHGRCDLGMDECANPSQSIEEGIACAGGEPGGGYSRGWRS